MTSTLNVELGDRSYPIVIGRQLLGGDFELTPYIRGDDCLIVSNQTVAPLYLDRLLPNLEGRSVSSIDLPDGEQYKTLATMASILDQLPAATESPAAAPATANSTTAGRFICPVEARKDASRSPTPAGTTSPVMKQVSRIRSMAAWLNSRPW